MSPLRRKASALSQDYAWPILFHQPPQGVLAGAGTAGGGAPASNSQFAEGGDAAGSGGIHSGSRGGDGKRDYADSWTPARMYPHGARCAADAGAVDPLSDDALTYDMELAPGKPVWSVPERVAWSLPGAGSHPPAAGVVYVPMVRSHPASDPSALETRGGDYALRLAPPGSTALPVLNLELPVGVPAAVLVAIGVPAAASGSPAAVLRSPLPSRMPRPQVRLSPRFRAHRLQALRFRMRERRGGKRRRCSAKPVFDPPSAERSLPLAKLQLCETALHGKDRRRRSSGEPGNAAGRRWSMPPLPARGDGKPVRVGCWALSHCRIAALYAAGDRRRWLGSGKDGRDAPRQEISALQPASSRLVLAALSLEPRQPQPAMGRAGSRYPGTTIGTTVAARPDCRKRGGLSEALPGGVVLPGPQAIFGRFRLPARFWT